MTIWSTDDLCPLEHPETIMADLRAMIDNVESLATLLGDLANLPNPMPGSLIAAQRLAQTIAHDGDGLLCFLRRNGFPIISSSAPTLSPRAAN